MAPHSIIRHTRLTDRRGISQTDRLPKLPSWWTQIHYQHFMKAMYKYGFDSFENFLIDQEFNFRERLSDVNLDKLDKGIRGFKIYEFDFLENKEDRLDIANYVAVHIYTTEGLKFFDRGIKKSDKFIKEYNVYEPYARLRVVSYGFYVSNPSFQGTFVPFPCGYISNRKITLNSNNVWFRFEVVSLAGEACFIITTSNATKPFFVGLRAQDTFEQAVTSFDPEYLEKNPISSTWLSGLGHSNVLSKISEFCNIDPPLKLPVIIKHKENESDDKITFEVEE